MEAVQTGFKHTGPEGILLANYTTSIVYVTLDKLMSLCLSFLIYEMWVVIALPHKIVMRIKIN